MTRERLKHWTDETAEAMLKGMGKPDREANFYQGGAVYEWNSTATEDVCRGNWGCTTFIRACKVVMSSNAAGKVDALRVEGECE